MVESTSINALHKLHMSHCQLFCSLAINQLPLQKIKQKHKKEKEKVQVKKERPASSYKTQSINWSGPPSSCSIKKSLLFMGSMLLDTIYSIWHEEGMLDEHLHGPSLDSMLERPTDS